MQTEVVFLGHIVGRTGLACDPAKLSAVQNWHAPDKVRGVQQFVGFVGYYRRFVKDFADLAEPLVALTRKGAPFVWTDWQQLAFEALKACLISAPFLVFVWRFVLDGGTDSPGDVGGGGDVHAFPVISTGGGGAQFTFRTGPQFPYGGYRNSVMKTACLPAGICYWDSFRLPSSTVRGPACKCGWYVPPM